MKLLQPVLKTLPPDKRFHFIDVLKKAARLGSGVSAGLRSDRDCLDEKIKDVLGRGKRDYWNGRRAVICVTHDVDYLAGYGFAGELAEIDKRHNIRSTFNFLTGWDYKIDRNLITSLMEQGFEIGLHGHTHDIALGARSCDSIKKDIMTALENLDYCGISGFRAPALSISERLLGVLAELNFSYDSSISGVDKRSGDVLYCFPYKYPGIDIWEIPLSVQDTYLFRDRNLSDDEAFYQTVKTIDRIADMGGAAVLNCHPCIIKDHAVFYGKLLKYIAGLNDVWNTSMRELVVYLDKN